MVVTVPSSLTGLKERVASHAFLKESTLEFFTLPMCSRGSQGAPVGDRQLKHGHFNH